MIDWTKPVRLVNGDGKPLTVLTTTRPGQLPVLTHDEAGNLYAFASDGSRLCGANAENIPTKHVRYMGVYCRVGWGANWMNTSLWDTRSKAWAALNVIRENCHVNDTHVVTVEWEG